MFLCASTLVLFFSSTVFSVCLLTSNTESRAEDDEAGVAVVEELVDESGLCLTQSLTCNQFSCRLLLNVFFFNRWSSGKYTHDSRRDSREKERPDFLREA